MEGQFPSGVAPGRCAKVPSEEELYLACRPPPTTDGQVEGKVTGGVRDAEGFGMRINDEVENFFFPPATS